MLIDKVNGFERFFEFSSKAYHSFLEPQKQIHNETLSTNSVDKHSYLVRFIIASLSRCAFRIIRQLKVVDRT